MSEEFEKIMKAIEFGYQYQVNCELTPEQCKRLIERIAELEEQLLKVSKEYAEMSFARRVNKHNETIRDSRGEA